MKKDILNCSSFTIANKRKKLFNNYVKGLPKKYGDNKIVLMIRDPYTLFTYWEINDEQINKIKLEIKKRNLSIKNIIIRLYKIGKDNSLSIFDDYVLDLDMDHYYINDLIPGYKWIIDIGILTNDKSFFSLSKSNVVQTPLNRIVEEDKNYNFKSFSSFNLKIEE